MKYENFDAFSLFDTHSNSVLIFYQNDERWSAAVFCAALRPRSGNQVKNFILKNIEQWNWYLKNGILRFSPEKPLFLPHFSTFEEIYDTINSFEDVQMYYFLKPYWLSLTLEKKLSL